MKTNTQLNRRTRSRIVLFSFKGKASVKKPDNNSESDMASTDHYQQKVIDLATLASWYAEQNATGDNNKEWNSPRLYAEKQKNLRFLTL